MKIYVASSWRCEYQPWAVKILREAGHEVYDFKNPPNESGFGWRELDPNWLRWSSTEFIAALGHARAEEGFRSDMDALRWCDVVVLVLPCGRSAHLELGWAVGAGKKTFIVLSGEDEPELMYKMVTKIVPTFGDLLEAIHEEEIRDAAVAGEDPQSH